MLAKYLAGSGSEWDELLAGAVFSYNTSHNDTTKETPFYLMFGREPAFPVDLLLRRGDSKRESVDVTEYRKRFTIAAEEARKRAIASSKEMMDRVKRQADKRHREDNITAGMLVLYRDYLLRVGMSAKFKNLWRDVYRVGKVSGCHAWITPRDKPEDVPKRVHLNQIKRFFCEEERELNEQLEATAKAAVERQKEPPSITEERQSTDETRPNGSRARS